MRFPKVDRAALWDSTKSAGIAFGTTMAGGADPLTSAHVAAATFVGTYAADQAHDLYASHHKSETESKQQPAPAATVPDSPTADDVAPAEPTAPAEPPVTTPTTEDRTVTSAAADPVAPEAETGAATTSENGPEQATAAPSAASAPASGSGGVEGTASDAGIAEDAGFSEPAVTDDPTSETDTST